jgi:selenide,water dikinase
MKDLVLVGGGHAHVQVIRDWMMRPLRDVRLSVVLDRAEALYSGMVPGFVAGDYGAEELEIDVVPLARRARARVVLAAATRVDPDARRIELEGRPGLAYDVASLDVGSAVRGLDLPGVRDHALATRPIRSFVDRLDERLARASPAQAGPLRVAVVGGGAAGLELAFTLRARLAAAGCEAQLSVLADTARLLPGHAAAVAERARREAERRGLRVLCDAPVERVEKDCLHVAGEREPLACDLAVWATGAAPPALLEASHLPLDAAGFVRVRDTFQVVGHDELFAVGDCASLEAHPWVPKAGVYAVRAGPVLAANLRARLGSGPLRRYRPQRDFLALLNLGGGEALGIKWGRVATGRAVFWLKDRIDRRFVRRFRVLDAEGRPAAHFPDPEQMGMEAMECGGCAAKLDAASLERALTRFGPPPHDDAVLLGLDPPDDAAALRLSGGEVLLASVDAFRSFTDDPWLVGRVAAVNAASDVLAKGGRPRHALALVNLPASEGAGSEELLFQVLAGVRAGLDPLGITLVGGHTTAGGDELSVGLSVTGELDDGAEPLRLDGARAGDVLVSSKGLGTGVVLAADMQGLARGAWVRAAHASMLRDNAEAARAARRFGARACTDVSGFGLALHLGSLLRASGVAAELDLAALPALDGALELLERGLRSTFHAQNAAAAGAGVAVAAGGGARRELLFDPQTSGGLLFSLPAGRADEAVAALREAGDERSAAIGRVVAARGEEPLLRVH